MNTRCAAVSGWRRRGEQHVATCGRANRAFDRRSGCFRVRSSLFAPASNHRALLRALSQTALDGPSPPCQLPLHCRRQIALPVAVAGSVGPFVCCCWMGDRRQPPVGGRSCQCVLSAADGAQVRRRPSWSVAAVPAALPRHCRRRTALPVTVAVRMASRAVGAVETVGEAAVVGRALANTPWRAVPAAASLPQRAVQGA